MTRLTRRIFLPPSMQSGAILERVNALAAEQGRTATFIPGKADDTTPLDPSVDIAVYQELDFAALTPDAEWTVAPPSALGSHVSFHKAMQPDQPDHWALTHGSAGAAGVQWLLDHGAQCLMPHGLEDAASDHPEPQNVGLLDSLYGTGAPVIGQSWDWREALIATSDAYRPDHEGWVNLTGRARHILSGPFMFLLPGRWRIEIEFDVDVETGVPRLAFQWGGAALEKTVFTTLLRKSGKYQVRLDAPVTRPDAAHCMVATDAAQLQGFLRLRSATLTYLGPLEG